MRAAQPSSALRGRHVAAARRADAILHSLCPEPQHPGRAALLSIAFASGHHHEDAQEEEEDWWLLERAATVTIGNVTLPLKAPPRQPELVPWRVAPAGSPIADDTSQEVLGHLRWMLQKDQLQQDMFLIGPPGPSRRWLAFRYCELTRREAEYVALSPDTTESDLKQRKEIIAGTVHHINQPPVVAAIEGRILVLEGMEKCERNVLPVLNNLLENREMTLEDGRMLVPSKRYDDIKQTHSPEQFAALRLVRVHPDFRVIALGLPVPRFAGNSLDPPLRSRFQAREVSSFTVGTQFAALSACAPELPPLLLRNLLSLSEAMRAMEAGDLMPNMPYFSDTMMLSCINGLVKFPYLWTNDHNDNRRNAPNPSTLGLWSLIHRLFPYTLLCDDTERESIELALRRFGVIPVSLPSSNRLLLSSSKEKQMQEQNQEATEAEKKDKPQQGPPPFFFACEVHLESIIVTPTSSSSQATFTFTTTSLPSITLVAPIGAFFKPLSCSSSSLFSSPLYVDTFFHGRVLEEMMQDHVAGKDLCLVGDKGIGKSMLIKLFASILGYSAASSTNEIVEKEDRLREASPFYRVIHCFKDMTSRDLLQRRVTDENGDTSWQPSPLILAALHGELAVLDGVHRLPRTTLSMLQRLISDREISLFDGTQLVRQERYHRMLTLLVKARRRQQQQTQSSSDTNNDHSLQDECIEELKKRKVYPVHPSFRVIVTGTFAPIANNSSNNTSLSNSITATTAKSGKQGWITSELLSLFHFHYLDSGAFLEEEKEKLLLRLFGIEQQYLIRKLLEFDGMFRQSSLPGLPATGLSLRQLIRLCKLSSSANQPLGTAVEEQPTQVAQKVVALLHQNIMRTIMAYFLPTQTRQAIEQMLEQCSIRPLPQGEDVESHKEYKIEVTDDREGFVRIGDVCVRRRQPTHPGLVPHVLFYDVPKHVAILKDLLRDFALGEHL
ncbi:von Willebrand factor A domain containing 8, partial [Balamuthia mandrillaris]